MIDIAALKDWLGLIALLISIGTSVVLFVGSGSKRNAAKLGLQEEKLTQHDRRIQTLESDIKHMPDKDTVTKLQVSMAEMQGQIASIVKSSEATERATRRVEDFLLKQSN